MGAVTTCNRDSTWAILLDQVLFKIFSGYILDRRSPHFISKLTVCPYTRSIRCTASKPNWFVTQTSKMHFHIQMAVEDLFTSPEWHTIQFGLVWHPGKVHNVCESCLRASAKPWCVSSLIWTIRCCTDSPSSRWQTRQSSNGISQQEALGLKDRHRKG